MPHPQAPHMRFLRGKHWDEAPDIERAFAEVHRELSFWHVASQHPPEVPAFSGGLMDSWPAWAVDTLALCRSETAAINAYFMAESRRGGSHG